MGRGFGLCGYVNKEIMKWMSPGDEVTRTAYAEQICCLDLEAREADALVD